MKRYQIALLFFAFGLFLFTFLANVLTDIISTRLVNQDYKNSGQEYNGLGEIKVFFSNKTIDPDGLFCEITYPVQRKISRLSDSDKGVFGEIIYSAVAELLNGPTKDEAKRGFFSSINSGVRVKKIVIEDETASVDFSGELNEGIAGSCKVQAIRSQIEQTLKQFPEIKEVVISVNGESEEILQP